MSERDVQDGAATFERIGAACDRIAAAGFPDVARAMAGRTRERRGRVQSADSLPMEMGRELLKLANDAERLVRIVEQQPPTEELHVFVRERPRGARASARTAAGIIELLPPGPPADYPERLDKALRAGDIHEVRRLRARRNLLANEGANPSERPETWDPATVDAVVRELESEDDVTVNVKLTSGPKFRAGWDAAVAHIRERFKGAARDTGGRDDG